MDTTIVSKITQGLTKFLHSNMVLVIGLIGLGFVIKYAWENADEIKEYIDKKRNKM